MPENKILKRSISINASAAAVWIALTNPSIMKLWMSDTGMEIISDWKVGSSIIISGDLHWKKFENKGTILKLEKEKLFEYNFLSSLSRLTDKPENYSTISFELIPVEKSTTLVLTLQNFPGKASYEHSDFYWKVTLEILKKLCEAKETL